MAPSAQHLEDIKLLNSIREAICDRHFAYDNRAHGGVVNMRTIQRIEEILDMPWRQGQEKLRREMQAS